MSRARPVGRITLALQGLLAQAQTLPPVSVQIFCLALAFEALNAVMSATLLPFPSAIDELQHISFVRWMEVYPSLFPRYETIRSLAPDLSHWAGQAAVTHPSPYYLAMAAIDWPTHSVLALRLANSVLALAGVALMLIAGFRALATDAQKAIYAALVVLYPKVGIVAGLVSNDNFALLSVGFGFLALVRWHERPGGWLLAFALAFAGWAKLTVFLMLGFSFVFAEVLARRRPGGAHLTLLLGGLAGAVPSVVNVVRYGSVVWHPPLSQNLGSHTLSVALFLRIAASELAQTWSALTPSSPVAVLGLVLVLGLGAVACVVGWRRWPVAVGTMLSLVPVLSLQLWFAWGLTVRYGYLDQIPSRYYYGIWPGFALGLALLWAERPGPLRLTLSAVTLVCLFMSSAAFCISLAISASLHLH